MIKDIDVKGLDGLAQFFRTANQRATQAAVMATNDAAQFARRLGSTEIRKQVNFKAGYLSSGGEDARLGVSKKATGDNIEAVVTGRDRPTSLARFSSSTPSVGSRRAPRVRVSANGATKVLQGAFFMRLRKGSQAVSAENSNIGLAVRLKRGDTIRNKRQAVPVGGGLYLLYGPSVGQVFAAVAADIGPQVSDKLSDEFIRQFERLDNG